MPLPTPVNTDLATLLLAFQNHLISDGLFNAATCFLALKPEETLSGLLKKGNQYAPSDQYCIITPAQQIVDEHVRIGAGRACMIFDGQFFLTLWVRSALDQVPWDGIWLTDPVVGSLQLAKCVLNSLELFQPVDPVTGDQLMPIGAELKSIDTYNRDQPIVGWGAIKLTFKMEWTFLFACP